LGIPRAASRLYSGAVSGYIRAGGSRSMPIEYRKDNDTLVWVRNPFTGVVTYFTHVHKKRSGFVREAQETLLREPPPDRAAYEARLRQDLEAAQRSCPFCPGNEALTPKEVLEVPARRVLHDRADDTWLIRAVPNLIPRIPECCTGGRNESYVVIEDPRHFADDAQGHEDLLYTGLLPLEQFQALLAADVEVARVAYANPAVRAVLIRKNQGRESGASQPHVHNQVIGSDIPFATIARECEVTAQAPHLWGELLAFAQEHGFILEERDGCYAYFCPFGTFPRSYEVVCPNDWARIVDVPLPRWRTFTSLLYNVVKALGPMPLDYEIHDGPGVPLHAHVNARHFTYSNIGGTLNLPLNLVAHPGALRATG
jgi:UDPglucose--hexose-1-phosphate uridylyltransferase